MKFLEIIRVALKAIATFAVFMLGVATASSHNIPLQTNLLYLSIAILAVLGVLGVNSAQKKSYRER